MDEATRQALAIAADRLGEGSPIRAARVADSAALLRRGAGLAPAALRRLPRRPHRRGGDAARAGLAVMRQRCGVIGYGRFGQLHSQAIARFAAADLAAIATASEASAALASGHHPNARVPPTGAAS